MNINNNNNRINYLEKVYRKLLYENRILTQKIFDLNINIKQIQGQYIDLYNLLPNDKKEYLNNNKLIDNIKLFGN